MYTHKNHEFPVIKSERQIILERQGCVFNDGGASQGSMKNHEADINKPCYCGRPLANKDK